MENIMSKKIIFACLLAVAFIAMNANPAIITRVKALKDLLNIRVDSSKLGVERDQAMKDALVVPPKGEFEDTAMYQKRLEEARLSSLRIKEDYDIRIADLQNNISQRKLLIESEIRNLLIASQEDYETRNFDFGQYNADLQELPVNIRENGLEFHVKMSTVVAKSVKSNISQYTVMAKRQLNDKLTWDYKNWSLKGAGYEFAMGDQDNQDVVAALPSDFKPPRLNATLINDTLYEPSGNTILDAEEKGYVDITVSNTGEGSALGVEVVVEGTTVQGLIWDRSAYYGEIKPNQEMTKRLYMTAAANVIDTTCRLTFRFKELSGFYPDAINLEFTTASLKRPVLVLAGYGVDAKDGMIKPEEMARVVCRLQNLGQGVARGVNLEASFGQNVFPLGNSTKVQSIGIMNPGEVRDVTLEFVANKDAVELPISVIIYEERPEFSTSTIPLELSLEKKQRTTREIVVAGTPSAYKDIDPAESLNIDVESNIPKTKVATNAIAVVLGIEDYQNISGVPYAKRDALWMKNYFMDALGIPEAKIICRTDAEVTGSFMRSLFGDKGMLARRAGDTMPDIYFYYSGHGAPSISKADAYLIPWEGNVEYIESSGYPLTQLYNDLNSLKAKSVTVFMDACFSGQSKDNVALYAGAKMPVLYTKPTTGAEKATVFSASQSNQISNVLEDKKHGLFSYYLMKGMQGSADKDQNKKITVGELREYLIKEVPNAANLIDREQNPDITSPDMSKILVDLN